MIKVWKKNRALKRYVKYLPSALAIRYGIQDYYTSGQIEKTLIEERFSIEYKEYAKVLFMEPAKYSTSDSEYAELVKELAAQFFGGDLDFSAQPIKKRTIGNAGFSSMGPNIEAFHD